MIQKSNLVSQADAIKYFKVYHKVFLAYLKENHVKTVSGKFINRDDLDNFNTWNEKRLERVRLNKIKAGRASGKNRLGRKFPKK